MTSTVQTIQSIPVHGRLAVERQVDGQKQFALQENGEDIYEASTLVKCVKVGKALAAIEEAIKLDNECTSVFSDFIMERMIEEEVEEREQTQEEEVEEREEVTPESGSGPGL